MRNARETIDYYNRKFVINITGQIRDFDGIMPFNLPPLNDTGFSTGYNQCLVRIKQVIISNETATLADQVNPVFVSNNNGGLSSCNAGIIVKLSFPSRQVKHISDNYVLTVFPEGHDQSFHQLISPEAKQTYIRSATAIDGRIARGSKQVFQTPQTAGDPQNAIDESVNFFEYQDTGSFEDSAVLCGVPFGQKHELKLRDAFNGQVLGGLASGLDTARGRNSTIVSLKLEILMLPNPTPEDR
jgi:hypothetical protein|tara:strand:- start:172 stop:897 length:726 start_codon:yes stop_codon:yes gene_type:complete